MFTYEDNCTLFTEYYILLFLIFLCYNFCLYPLLTKKEKIDHDDRMRLTWVSEKDHRKHKYRIPELHTPTNLTTVEDHHSEVARLQKERQELIDEVLHLNKELRDLKNKNERLGSSYDSEVKENRKVQKKLTLSIINAHEAGGDQCICCQRHLDDQGRNKLKHLSKYLLGESKKSIFRPFEKGEYYNNDSSWTTTCHEYSFGDVVEVFMKPPKEGTGNEDLVPVKKHWCAIECGIVLEENETELLVLPGVSSTGHYLNYEEDPYYLKKEFVRNIPDSNTM